MSLALACLTGCLPWHDTCWVCAMLPMSSHSQWGWTPLMLAAKYGSVGVITLLLDKGAKLEDRAYVGGAQWVGRSSCLRMPDRIALACAAEGQRAHETHGIDCPTADLHLLITALGATALAD